MIYKDAIVLELQEGPAINYFKAFQRYFGGEIKESTYSVKSAAASIHMCSYSFDPEIELLVSEAWHQRALKLDRFPEGDPEYVHLYLVLEGSFRQTFRNTRVEVEAGSVKGAFLYNGLFPLRDSFPPGTTIRTVGFKFTRASVERLLPDALSLYNELIMDQDGVMFHSHIPSSLERLCSEIFQLREAEFGRKSMIIARGIEALTSVFHLLHKERQTDHLNGLHVDDYNRLQRIKERILSRVNERVSLECLSREYGISVSKLKRDFKILFSSSVYQFYTHARMDEAYNRLKSGKFTVMEVGFDMGYTNLSKFSEMFKKVKGISPSELL